MDSIGITEWGEQEFAGSREAWTDLLENSSADRLFMSWEWLHTWWRMFAVPGEMKLRLFVAIDADGRLVGIAPLYVSRTITRKFLRTRRLQFIGNRWRGPSTMLTELQDFITRSSESGRVTREFLAYINSRKDWDEFVLPGLNRAGSTCRLLESERPLADCYYRNAEQAESYYLDTTGSFKEYLEGLGKSTRLRIYNRRKLLNSLGEVKYERLSTDNLDELFEALNYLHEMRWESPVFAHNRLEFNQCVASLFAEKNQLAFSQLSVDGVPVSIQYNFVVKEREYNIQGGFKEGFHRRISPGYLHFGYAIEQAFSGTTMAYDFLVGKGKHMQYKANLTKTSLTVVDIQIIRPWIHRMLYRLYDRFRVI